MKKQKIMICLLISGVVILAILVFLQFWTGISDPAPVFEEPVSEADLAEGKRLSGQYCTSCHRYPGPELLTGETWRDQTLPAMGPLLGIFQHRGQEYPKDTNPHVPEGTYPSRPLLSSEEWQKILAYYANTAPKTLIGDTKTPAIKTDSLFFEARTPHYRTDEPPASTLAKFDPGNQLLYLSDIDGTNFLIFNRNLELDNTLYLSAALSDVQIINNVYESGSREILLTYIGSLYPSDAPEGFIVRTEFNPAQSAGGQSGGTIETIRENLTRPVQTLSEDLNQDGREDLLIHEFGHRRGSLFWLENRGEENPPLKRILLDRPGCIQSHITDYNQNGLPDIISLCTQADQSIYLFQNSGEGEFVRKTLLEFPITAGSTSFELHDFNDDGHPDILYTSGDNADFSIAFKPYHGVYIYLNDGNGTFTEAWFYPVNGAYDARAADFNGDGNPEIALISYFADYVNRPAEGFIFFENNGDNTLSFTPWHHPAASSGRWIAMDVADWTGNGYDDILLANFSIGPDVSEEQAQMDEVFRKGPLFLLLENRCPERC